MSMNMADKSRQLQEPVPLQKYQEIKQNCQNQLGQNPGKQSEVYSNQENTEPKQRKFLNGRKYL